uniref:Uncharacterized protein n=1 Tax=Trichogramma kaykai TaxID=54128 RepID=A0ABD2WH41_9HYME
MLERLKRLREAVVWESTKERLRFLNELCTIITPDLFISHLDLEKILPQKEIDLLLREAMLSWDSDRRQFIHFWPALATRTNPRSINLASHLRDLFRIYDRFDVNYDTGSGLTHFHAACMWGLFDVIEKFLELGQDPNVLVQSMRNSPLHLALDNVVSSEVIKLLLRKGADLRLVNAKGSTPLHIFCKKYDDVELAKHLLDLNNEKHQLPQVDVRDKSGKTPLHLALEHSDENVAEFLLRNGADPNLADAEGATPLHKIC